MNTCLAWALVVRGLAVGTGLQVLHIHEEIESEGVAPGWIVHVPLSIHFICFLVEDLGLEEADESLPN